MGGIPSTTIEIAFSTDPGATPVWTDVTPYWTSWGSHRGRQHELDVVQAGESYAWLRDPDGRFNPTNAAGPYYPNVRPMRRIRKRTTYAGITTDQFNGYIESWQQTWTPGPGGIARVKIECVDAFEPLNLGKVSITRSQEGTGARITAILDAISWPSADRTIDTGKSLIQGVTFADTPALQALQDTAFTEGGLLFISRDGKVTFLDRTKLITSVLDTANHTWGDAGAEKDYADVEPQFDKTQIFNIIKVTAPGKTDQIATDATSKGRYFQRDRVASTLHADQNEMTDRANYELSRFKEPALRIKKLELESRHDDAQWEHILHHDLHDKVRVIKRPPTGGVIQQDSFIEGITHEVTARSWKTTWNLSPIGAGATDYFIWGVSRWGVDTRWYW